MIKYIIFALIGIFLATFGELSGRSTMKDKILKDPEKYGLMKKPKEEEVIAIPLASDARMLTSLAIESEYANSPYKRDLVNQMKTQINAAINMGKTYTEFDASLKKKIRLNFTRMELDNIFASLGYVIRYNQFGEFEWISWDAAALPETEEMTQIKALNERMTLVSQPEPIPNIEPIFRQTS